MSKNSDFLENEPFYEKIQKNLNMLKEKVSENRMNPPIASEETLKVLHSGMSRPSAERIKEPLQTNLKICVVGTRGFPNVQGSIESHCEKLYPYLAQKGCNVTVFTRRGYAPEDLIMYKGVRMVDLLCFKNKFMEAFLHTFCAVWKARRFKPDIIHFHAIGPSLLVPFARLLGMNVVVTHHGADYNRNKWNSLAKHALKTGEIFGAKWAHEMISVSPSIADYLRISYKRSTVFIPNGVTIPCACRTHDTLKKFNLEKEKYILTVGRFVPEKAFHDLIEAFRLVKKKDERARDNKWKLVIVGDADHEDEYSRSLKNKASCHGDIVLTGFLKGEPLEELFSHAGLFVLPSYHEGLPIALLEAMSYGLRCIASDIPANKNVQLNRDRYFLTGNIPSLAQKISFFLENPMTENEKKEKICTISKNYDWDKISNQTLDVYQSILREKNI